MATLKLKRGDTFEVKAEYLNDDGAPVDLNGVSIRSQVRSEDGQLIAELDIVKFAEIGAYTLSAPSTINWPVGCHVWDIEYTQEGVITSTKTITLSVFGDVTYGE